MKKISFLLCLSGIAFTSQLSWAGTYKECIEIANEVNQGVPQRIDRITTLVSAVCKEDGRKVIFSYNYQIEAEATLTQKDISSLKAGQVNVLCTNPDIKPLINEFDIEMSYSDQARKFIGSNRIGKKNCRAVQ